MGTEAGAGAEAGAVGSLVQPALHGHAVDPAVVDAYEAEGLKRWMVDPGPVE